MSNAGIDTSVWAPHSSRSAAASYQRKQLNCTEILKLADWSAGGGVYQRYAINVMLSTLCYQRYVINVMLSTLCYQRYAFN